MLHPSLYSTSNSTYGAFEKPKPSAYTTSGTFLSKSVDAKLSVSAMGLDEKTALLIVSEGSQLAEVFTKSALDTTEVILVKHGATFAQVLASVGKLGATYDVVGVKDHGHDGFFNLGGNEADLHTIDQNDFIVAFLKELGTRVKPGGRLELLGCAVEAGAEGQKPLDRLQARVGVKVAALLERDSNGLVIGRDGAAVNMHDEPVVSEYFDLAAVGTYIEAFVGPLKSAVAGDVVVADGGSDIVARREEMFGMAASAIFWLWSAAASSWAGAAAAGLIVVSSLVGAVLITHWHEGITIDLGFLSFKKEWGIWPKAHWQFVMGAKLDPETGAGFDFRFGLDDITKAFNLGGTANITYSAITHGRTAKQLFENLNWGPIDPKIKALLNGDGAMMATRALVGVLNTGNLGKDGEPGVAGEELSIVKDVREGRVFDHGVDLVHTFKDNQKNKREIKAKMKVAIGPELRILIKDHRIHTKDEDGYEVSGALVSLPVMGFTTPGKVGLFIGQNKSENMMKLELMLPFKVPKKTMAGLLFANALNAAGLTFFLTVEFPYTPGPTLRA